LPEPKRQEAEPVKAAAVKGAEQLITQFETNVGKNEEEKNGERKDGVNTACRFKYVIKGRGARRNGKETRFVH